MTLEFGDIECGNCGYQAAGLIDSENNNCPTCGPDVTVRWIKLGKIGGHAAPKAKPLTSMRRSERRKLFLQEMSQRGNITQACEAAGISRSTFQRWLEKSDAFRKRFEMAQKEAADRLEAEARRRAVDGVLEPVGFFKGVPGGYVRKYSDTLLTQLLRAHNEKFNTQNINIQGILAKIDVTRLSDDQLNRLAAGESVLTVLGPELERHLLESGEPQPTGRELNPQ